VSAREKIAYLRGLLDGGHPSDEAQARVMGALIEALEALASEVDVERTRTDDQERRLGELSDYLDDIEDDLARIEDEIDRDEEDSEEAEEEDEEDYVPVRCPGCGKEFFYDPDEYDADEQLLCPRCGEPFLQPGGADS
jgi:DNA-directed RNA polymerase subunit RPC12/RpoP